MSGLLILILIFIGIPLLWRWIKPFVFRWMQRRTEDYMRSAMGMPPRDRSRSGSRQRSGYRDTSHNPGRRSGGRYHGGPLIPKEYAVDVEYTEIRSYSTEETIASDGKHISYAVESQVSDAEIIEISKDR